MTAPLVKPHFISYLLSIKGVSCGLGCAGIEEMEQKTGILYSYVHDGSLVQEAVNKQRYD
jgi:hypothetical protein